MEILGQTHLTLELLWTKVYVFVAKKLKCKVQEKVDDTMKNISFYLYILSKIEYLKKYCHKYIKENIL